MPTSSLRGPGRISPTSGRARCRARGFRPRTRTHPSTSRCRVDKARHAGDAVAVIAATSRGAAEDAAELVEVEYEPLPAVVDPGGRARGRRAARPRGVRDEPVLHVDARRGRGRAAVRGGGRDGERAVSPEPADPERDRAARGVRHADSRHRRVHAVVDDAGAAHRAASRSAASPGSRSRSCA